MSWNDRIVARAMVTSHAAPFADAVAARHRGDPSAWLRCSTRTGGVARVLLHRRREVVRSAPASITIAPRIELRLASARARAGDGAPLRMSRVADARRELRTLSAPSAAPMLERAAARFQRDDGQTSRPDARARRSLAPRAVPNADALPTSQRSAAPVRVLRRRAPVPAEPSAPVRDERPARAAAPLPRAVPLSPVEIDRLTDHIVQTIDRRISAFRERQGRV